MPDPKRAKLYKMRECTKPNCDCLDKAEAEAGGHVKNYECLGKPNPNDYNFGFGHNEIDKFKKDVEDWKEKLNSDKNVQVSDTTKAK